MTESSPGGRRREALYYEPLGNGFVRCRLCPHQCRIAEGRPGICLGRVNHDGRLYAESFGLIVSAGMDPIEKKPLYHFHPGRMILSIATYGCNLTCPFCQNFQLSRQRCAGRAVLPEELPALAKAEDSFGVAFTYTEPLVWFEFVLDACRQLRANGCKTVLVTNGMVNEEPARELLPWIDAVNIDLKSIRADFYRNFLGGDLETVKNTIRLAREQCHIELTNLLIPTLNDSDDEIKELVDFVAGLGRSTVLHFSAYHPTFRLSIPATPSETLFRAKAIACKKLDYVYLGNIGSDDSNDTRCPGCGNLLITRRRYHTTIVGIENGICTSCGRKTDIIMPPAR